MFPRSSIHNVCMDAVCVTSHLPGDVSAHRIHRGSLNLLYSVFSHFLCLYRTFVSCSFRLKGQKSNFQSSFSYFPAGRPALLCFYASFLLGEHPEEPVAGSGNKPERTFCFHAGTKCSGQTSSRTGGGCWELRSETELHRLKSKNSHHSVEADRC